MDHETWRRFQNEARSEDALGVVDGDLVEQFFVSISHTDIFSFSWLFSGFECPKAKGNYCRNDYRARRETN